MPNCKVFGSFLVSCTLKFRLYSLYPLNVCMVLPYTVVKVDKKDVLYEKFVVS